MKLKYEKEISLLKSDFSNFEARDKKSYRLVFEDLLDVRNFLPVNILNPLPDRILNFKGFGLSFFDTRESLIENFKYLSKGKPNFYKKRGTHVAEGNVTVRCGLTEINHSPGHFCHFEYCDIKLSAQFTIICEANQ